MTEQTTKANTADAIIKNYMLGAIGVGFIPLPVLDVTALIAVQLKMLHSLAKVYEVDFSEDLGKKVITSCLGGSIPVSLSYSLGALLRAIPVYGWVIKGISSSAFSGAFTYAIGKLFVQHFESGNTFLTLDPQRVNDYFLEKFEKGSEFTGSFIGVKP